MNKHLLFIVTILAIIFANSCSKEQPNEPLKFGVERYDSAALHIALVPNHDCLPLYYAKRTGIYDSLGLKIQIASYPSQMDCDTTLMGIADGGWADLTRIAHYGGKMTQTKVLWRGTQQWQLFTCGTLRINSLKALVGRTVAIARSTDEELWLSTLLKQAKVNSDDIFFPQINDLRLRALMLKGDQVDAALLTWPYTSLALANGHRCIAQQSKSQSCGAFVMKVRKSEDANKKKQWELLERGRKIALDSIRIKGAKAYSIILQKDYKIPQNIADTIKF